MMQIMSRKKVDLSIYSINHAKKINFERLFFFMGLCITTLTFLFIVFLLDPHKYQLSILFSVLLALAISGFFIMNKKLVLFEPVVLFSAYYVTVVISCFYSIFTDWELNEFVNNSSFRDDITILTAYTCMYFFVGYLFMVAGYYLVKKDDFKIQFVLDSRSRISNTVLNIFIIIFLSIGIANFAYNVSTLAGGSILQYMANVSVRHLEFENQGTTLGYMFAYNGMFIWFFKLARRHIYWNKYFIVFLIISILMKASTGRIFGTMLYMFSFVGIYYFLEASKNKVINNTKYYLAVIGILIFGVVFYFLRIISSLFYNNMLHLSVGTELLNGFKFIGYYAVDKGNIPNLGVFLKIVDSWGTDIGYLYGQSLFTWITNILPPSMRPEAYQPSVMIKQVWYSHLQGGNLPPTGIGEMYANFGFLGPALGMFLFGCFAALLYNYTIKSKSFWVLAIYIQIAIGFIMLYPKGEFDNLTLWHVIPLLLTITAFKIISKAGASTSKEQKTSQNYTRSCY
jgi:oligosaccharide repeat unit polymerase